MRRYKYENFNKQRLSFCHLLLKTCLLSGICVPILHGVGIRGLDNSPMMGMPPTNDLDNDMKKMESVEHEHGHEHGDHNHEVVAPKNTPKSQVKKKDVPIGELSNFFIGFNYQASGIQNQVLSSNLPQPAKMTMNFPPLVGVGLQLGYKQFFGPKRSFGLRYFVFFDYNHNRFGSLKADTEFPFGAYTMTEKDSYAGQYTSNLYTYGAGMDMIYNFVSTKDFIFGFAVGFQLAGDSWATSIEKQLQSYAKNNKHSSYSPANFQFLVNFALRAQISKKNGIELGIKIPTITHRYFSLTNSQGQTLQANIRRVYAFQISYIRDF
ncbi:hypothetical protein NHP200010_07440 [Helicobacter bizzozeronii]|nr:hypothetical protein NHP200010_07440 [Helicobacter bizzozeronii]